MVGTAMKSTYTNGREVIVQEGSPRLRRWSPATPHVLADAALTDVDAEFEQFAMDTWRAPEKVAPRAGLEPATLRLTAVMLESDQPRPKATKIRPFSDLRLEEGSLIAHRRYPYNAIFRTGYVTIRVTTRP